jgi:hypothetical protein
MRPVEIARHLGSFIFFHLKRFHLVKFVPRALQLDAAFCGVFYLVNRHENFVKRSPEALYHQVCDSPVHRIADRIGGTTGESIRTMHFGFQRKMNHDGLLPGSSKRTWRLTPNG